MFATIFTLVFVVLAVFAILGGILKSRKFHWSEALVRIVLVIIALMLTITLTSVFALKISDLLVKPLASPSDGSVVSTFLSDMDITDVAAIFAEMESAQKALAIIFAVIITPVFFLICFGIIKGILIAFSRPANKLCLLIAGKIAKKDYISEIYGAKDLTKKERKAFRKKKFTLKSAICGVVCSLLAFAIILIPIIGTLEMAASICKTVTDEGVAYDISNNVASHPVTSIMHPISAPVWKSLTSYTVNGEKIVMENEAHFITVFMQALAEITSSDIDTLRSSAAKFRALSTLCKDTTLVPWLCSDFINTATTHWNNGEEFANISKPEDELISMLIERLENSTPQTMREDLVTVTNVLAILAENANINEEGKIDTAALLENNSIVSMLSVELLKNDRLAPVVGNLVKQQLEATDTKLDLPAQDDEEYTNLVDNIFNTYQENVGEDITEDSLNNLSNAVGDVLEDQGIVLEEYEKLAIASTFISEFGDPSQLTTDMITNLIEQYRKNQ